MTGIEPFVDPFAGGLVGILVDTAKKVGGGLAQTIGDRTKDTAALKKYSEKYNARYGEVRLLGMKQGIPLETIYTKVKFLDELTIRQFTSLNALEQTYRKKQKRRFQEQEPKILDSFIVVNENQCLMVLGKPGAGKSTFLRRTGLEAFKGARGNLRQQCIPVLLELKQFTSDSVDLVKTIADELVNFGFPETEQFTLNLLEQGKLLVLLDGIDEVPKNYQIPVIEAIQNFVTRYDQNRYVASCRIAAHHSAWSRFQDVEIADFDDAQIQQFISNWFSSRTDLEARTSERCWGTLNSPGNIAVKELAQTPLLLTFICMVYDRIQKLPTNRATLYQKALDILLEEWAAEKRIRQESIYQGLNSDLEKALLSEIAYYGFVSDQLFFTQQELVEQIKGFLADTVDKPKYLDGKAVLDAIAIQQGILVERSEDIFSFSHLTIQEYLTAQYISQDSDSIKDLVANYLANQRWQEVFLLVSGSIRSSDKLLESMKEKAQEYVDFPRLRILLTWASQITSGSQNNFSPTCNRAIAIAWCVGLIGMAATRRNFLDKFNTINNLTVHPTLVYQLADGNFDDLFVGRGGSVDFFCDTNRVNMLEKLKVFNNVNFTKLIAKLHANQARNLDDAEDNPEFIRKTQEIWLDALKLQQAQVVLSQEEAEALANYLYSNVLIIECKRAAIRVSETAWKKIEGRMLLPEI